jgi:ADP-heptose:LPS heptosyltransferase
VNVELMRTVDLWAGTLACYGIAGYRRITRRFVRPRTEVKKIVVMKFFGLGSIVVASPCLAALREIYPGAEIHFVTFKGNRELLEILQLTDKNYFIDPSSPAAFTRSTLATIKELRAEDCDLAIDLEFFAKFPLILANLAGIPRNAGFYLQVQHWRRSLLDVWGSYNHYYHTRDIFLSLAYLLATGDHYFLAFGEFAARYRYPVYRPNALERAAMRRKLGGRVAGDSPVFVINPNTSPDLAPEARKWPEDRYAGLATELLREHPTARIAFIGAPSERAYVERIAAQVGDRRAFSTAGELSLRELLALFAEATLVISNDSGPMHLACLVDAPTIGLFFAESPTLFAPLGTNVRAIAPRLYSIPLFTVYNGKDESMGKPMAQVSNAAACAVSLADVMAEVRPMLAGLAAPARGVEAAP